MKKVNSKYDYAELLSKFNDKEYKIFNTIANSNESYLAQRLYIAIKNNVAGAATMFLTTGDEFKQWLTNYSPSNQEFSNLDTEIIGHIVRNKEWVENYNDDVMNIDSVVNYLIASWSNRTKTLKVNMDKLNMIYQRYIRFLNTEKGQDFAFGKSLDLMPDYECESEGAYYTDKPFWEEYSYREEQLLKLKKHCIQKISDNAIQMVEVRALWEAMFENNGRKFSLASARDIARKYIDKKAIGDTTLYKYLRKLRIELLKEIMAHVDEYFDETQLFELNGKIVNIKTALEEYLRDATMDEIIAKKNDVESRNIVVTEAVENWCCLNHVRYSKDTHDPNILVMVRADSNGNTKDHYCLYFYKGGGYRDFTKHKTGYYTEIVQPFLIGFNR